MPARYRHRKTVGKMADGGYWRGRGDGGDGGRGGGSGRSCSRGIYIRHKRQERAPSREHGSSVFPEVLTVLHKEQCHAKQKFGRRRFVVVRRARALFSQGNAVQSRDRAAAASFGTAAAIASSLALQPSTHGAAATKSGWWFIAAVVGGGVGGPGGGGAGRERREGESERVP